MKSTLFMSSILYIGTTIQASQFTLHLEKQVQVLNHEVTEAIIGQSNQAVGPCQCWPTPAGTWNTSQARRILTTEIRARFLVEYIYSTRCHAGRRRTEVTWQFLLKRSGELGRKMALPVRPPLPPSNKITDSIQFIFLAYFSMKSIVSMNQTQPDNGARCSIGVIFAISLYLQYAKMTVLNITYPRLNYIKTFHPSPQLSYVSSSFLQKRLLNCLISVLLSIQTIAPKNVKRYQKERQNVAFVEQARCWVHRLLGGGGGARKGVGIVRSLGGKIDSEPEGHTRTPPRTGGYLIFLQKKMA